VIRLSDALAAELGDPGVARHLRVPHLGRCSPLVVN
jgi:hypothetical protein